MNENRTRRNFFSKASNYRTRDSSRFNNYNRYVYNRNRRYNNNAVTEFEINRPLPPRPPSPKLGSEEYTQRKIEQTSKQIMKHLCNPVENPMIINGVDNDKDAVHDNCTAVKNSTRKQKPNDSKMPATKKPNKVTKKFDIQEMHRKIISHITNLNDGRKRNLINTSTATGYDLAIQQIQQQRRLDISRALRNVCNEENGKESTEYINSIIPDIGISFEDVPKELIEELTKKLDLDFESPVVNFTAEMLEPNGVQNFLTIRDDLHKLLDVKLEDGSEFNVSHNVISLVNSGLEAIDAISTDSSHSNTEKTFSLSQTKTVAVETENTTPSLDSIIKLYVNDWRNKPNVTLADCMTVMKEVDEAIAKLTECRQLLFSRIAVPQPQIPSEDLPIEKKKRGRKRKRPPTPVNDTKHFTSTKLEATNAPPNPSFQQRQTDEGNTLLDNLKVESDSDNTIIITDTDCELKEKHNIRNRHGVLVNQKIVVVKIIDKQIIAASETGCLYIYDLDTCEKIDSIQVSNQTITAFCHNISNTGETLLYVSSLEAPLKTVNLEKGVLTMINVRFNKGGEQVQCMDLAFGYIFLGCFDGTLLRYNILRERFEFSEQIANNVIYALKATMEGARPVILVASRNSAVCIRDAMSGLFMRCLDTKFNTTIYSMLIENKTVFCGTVGQDILTYSFYDGTFKNKIRGGLSDTINCMKTIKHILFASSKSNGNIYMFDLNTTTLVECVREVGCIILSMDVDGYSIVIGTMSKEIISIPIPDRVMKHLQD